MKKQILILIIILISFSCKNDNKNENASTEKINTEQITATEDTAFGSCSKCGCRGWRPDSDNPEKCVNIRVPTSALCQHSRSDHFSRQSVSLIDSKVKILLETGEHKEYLVEDAEAVDLEISEIESLSQDKDIQNLYCLEWVEDVSGSYNGQNARFGVWKPNSSSPFGCCVIVNIVRNNRIVARQRVNVTHSRQLRILIGQVNGVSQSVSPCR